MHPVHGGDHGGGGRMTLHIGYERGTRTPYTGLAAEHLKTHALCVGMTGSGKTGLCIALLEELALKRIPMVLIDPKGDLGNIAFIPRNGVEMRATTRPEDARSRGMTHEQWAEAHYAEWQLARQQDGITDEMLEQINHTWMRIYTPGGGPGVGLSILSALRHPRLLDGLELRAEIVADTLLALVKKSEQTQHARSLLSNILVECWQRGEDATLPSMIDAIIDPPMASLGGLDVETYYPRIKRMKLAQELNGILSSPTWESWLIGDALDFGQLLYTPDGEPTVTIINIAHLGDQQRHFFVALLLNQAIQWMREQPGSQDLKALLYMDEVAGYFPPTGNPPAKRAAMTLIKQARAFGLGLMFASQNPVDIDYKMMGNMGLWLIGKLNTERDKRRLEDGMEEKQGCELIGTLKKREFLVRSIYSPPTVIRSRTTMAHLFGPVEADIIRVIAQAVGGGGGSKRELYKQRLQQMQVAMDKQQVVVSALQKDIQFAVGGSVLTILAGILFGRRGSVLRQVTRKPPRKAQQLMEARARLQAMQEQFQSTYQLWEAESE